jgi:peptidoglycan DL-endopeptidase CwlO
LCFIALALMVLVMPQLVAAQTLDQKKTDAQTEVSQNEQRLEDAVEKYKGACDRLEATRGQISENKEKITQTEEELAARQAALNMRARAMYVSHQTRFVDVVVSSGNLDQFLVGMDLLKRVGRSNATLVRGVKNAKAALERHREELQAQKDEQEAARQQMASSKSEVEAALAQSKGKLASVEEEIRVAMARRAAEAASGSTSGSRIASRIPYPVIRNSVPPGTPHPGVVGVAYDQLGKPYVWGATGPDCFDCSGLTTYCYRVGANIEIPRSSYDQANCGAEVGTSQLAPGDILGFRGWGHVGLYIGNGQFIHAPHTGDVVRIGDLSSRGNWCGARRP